MRQWAKDFKINKPIPRDIVPLLAKDEATQLEIMMNNVSLGREAKNS